MYKVEKVEVPVFKSLLKREVIGYREAYEVVDVDTGEGTWQCALEVTAEMFCASMNRDLETGGNQYEIALNTWLS